MILKSLQFIVVIVQGLHSIKPKVSIFGFVYMVEFGITRRADVQPCGIWWKCIITGTIEANLPLLCTQGFCSPEQPYFFLPINVNGRDLLIQQRIIENS